jgi:catechol 2,3-dioxygenase-like lactoylglutathione lyase family enzyme
MGEPPILDQFNLVVSDMEATVTFYRRLGLTIADTDAEWQPHHRNAQLPGGIDLDFDSVSFARHWDRGWRGGMGVIGFKVDSREHVDEIYADLTGAGYVGQQEPYDAYRPARRRQPAPEASIWPLTCGFVLSPGYRWCPNCTAVVLRS